MTYEEYTKEKLRLLRLKFDQDLLGPGIKSDDIALAELDAKYLKTYVVIGDGYDHFSIKVDDTTYYFDQETSPAEKLKSMFESLGYNVTIEPNY